MDVTIQQVSKMLADRCDAVTTMLFPNGKRVNGHLCVGDVSGSPGESLKVEMHGQHAGHWRDWAGDGKGDLIDLWAQVRGIALPEALRQARDYLGIAAEVRPAREKQYAKPKESDEAAQGGRIRKYLCEVRKLENSTINRFRIGVLVRDEDGKKAGFIVFPCYSPDGSLINNSYCGLDRRADGKKKVFQDTGCAPCLFGWHALDAGAYERRSIIICEGQIDCMTWTQWGFDSLSIPNGGGNTWIEYEFDNLAVFETIYLSYDMDGKLSSVQEAAISRLGKHRCMLIKLPHKDANACLQAGTLKDEIQAAVNEAKPPKLVNFASLTDIKDRVMKHFFPEAGEVLIQPATLKGPFPDKTFTIRPGEVSVWTGIASHGKSSLLAQIFMELVMLGQVVMVTSLEMKPERVVKKMAMCAGNGGGLERADVSEFIDLVGEKICFCDKVGSVTTLDLFEMMRFAYARYGATQFMIDSMMRIEGLEEDYKAQGKFLNELCQFAAESMVHIHLVAHPRKTAEDAKPSANDLKGSSLIRNNADNVIVVHRNFMKEQKFASGDITEEEFSAEWDTSVMVEKDREEGTVKAFKYKFNRNSQKFVPMVAQPKEFRENPRRSRRDD